MRHVRFTKIALIGLLTYAAFPASNAVAQDIAGQPRIIADARVAACVNHLGQTLAQNGSAQVPFTLRIERVSGVTAPDVPVALWQQPANGGAFTELAHTTTDGTGGWTLTAPPGSSRLLRVVAGAILCAALAVTFVPLPSFGKPTPQGTVTRE